MNRYAELIGKGATTQVNVDNSRTQADILRGTVRADEANLENLKVQKSYTQLRAPITGRISAAMRRQIVNRTTIPMIGPASNSSAWLS